MRIVAISDTHGLHKQLTLPEGDMLIHAGDVSAMGREREVMRFLKWFARQPFEHKVFIAGNHDLLFEKEPELAASYIPEGVTYLNDSGITIDGLNIWGSPVQPWFFDWAFNRQRGGDIEKHWELIPDNTDLLITHGPPMNHRDLTLSGENVGCQSLSKKVLEIQPRYHVFGHIHESYGITEQVNTTFINASVVNRNYVVVNEPVVFTL